MAICFHCKIEETQFHEDDVPICLECSEARAIKPEPAASEHEIRAVLSQEFIDATARKANAVREFEEAIDRYHPSRPTPDGTLRIKNASKAFAVARKEIATANNRLNDYLTRGIVPKN